MDFVQYSMFIKDFYIQSISCRPISCFPSKIGGVGVDDGVVVVFYAIRDERDLS